MERRDLTYSVWWNVLLLTAGSFLLVLGLKAIALPHNFLPGGLFGFSFLIYYLTHGISPGWLYFLLNIPLFVVGWLYVSRRFFFYSLYATTLCTLLFEGVSLEIHVESQLYAALAAGVISGAGGGVILRSLGSAGGLDILAVILNERYNFGIGKFYFLYNAVLYSSSLFLVSTDLVIASLLLVFVSSQVVDYVMALFNQRKLTFIISAQADAIARRIMDVLGHGVTMLQGVGAFTGSEKRVLMTVIHNIQLKRLEQIVFSEDPHAFFVVENTFNVLGTGFSQRKLY